MTKAVRESQSITNRGAERVDASIPHTGRCAVCLSFQSCLRDHKAPNVIAIRCRNRRRVPIQSSADAAVTPSDSGGSFWLRTDGRENSARPEMPEFRRIAFHFAMSMKAPRRPGQDHRGCVGRAIFSVAPCERTATATMVVMITTKRSTTTTITASAEIDGLAEVGPVRTPVDILPDIRPLPQHH